MEILMVVIRIKPNPTQDSGYLKERVRDLEKGIRETKKNQLLNKLKTVTRMVKLFKTVREEHENILKLKGMCPDNKIPRGLLMQGRSAIEDAVDTFKDARTVDVINEKRPEL